MSDDTPRYTVRHRTDVYVDGRPLCGCASPHDASELVQYLRDEITASDELLRAAESVAALVTSELGSTTNDSVSAAGTESLGRRGAPLDEQDRVRRLQEAAATLRAVLDRRKDRVV